MKKLLGIALSVLTFSVGAVAGDSTSPEKEAHYLLEQLEIHAVEVRNSAAELRTANRFPLLHSPEYHELTLNRIESNVEDISKVMGKFPALKDKATVRQNRAFNAALEHAEKLSDATAKAVSIANENQPKMRIGHPDYDKAVDKIYNQADFIAASADLAESWEEVSEARETLSQSE